MTEQEIQYERYCIASEENKQPHLSFVEWQAANPAKTPRDIIERFAVIYSHYLDDRYQDDLSETFSEWLVHSLYRDSIDAVMNSALTMAQEYGNRDERSRRTTPPQSTRFA